MVHYESNDVCTHATCAPFAWSSSIANANVAQLGESHCVLLLGVCLSHSFCVSKCWCLCDFYFSFIVIVSLRRGGGSVGIDGGGMVWVWQVLVHLGLIAGSIWWNHLLGGARRWAILSGQLASQLVDQADAAAGIAFLTRDWAEMARRSLAALDEDCVACISQN